MPSLPATPDCRGPMSTTPGRFVVANAARRGWPADDRRLRAGRPRLRGTINVVLPVPGDVRGLAAGTQFERDALAAGEAVIIANPEDPTTAVGLVPEFSYSDVEEATLEDDGTATPELCALSWIVYSLPGAPVLDHYELGDAEYTLRSAVRSKRPTPWAPSDWERPADVADPRGLVEQLLESARQHRIPDHAPTRALRVLENASHIDAIIAVSAGLSRLPGAAGPQSSSEAQIATDALRPLTAVVRSARMAAVNAILDSAWPD